MISKYRRPATRELVTIIAFARPPVSGITFSSKIRSITSALYCITVQSPVIYSEALCCRCRDCRHPESGWGSPVPKHPPGEWPIAQAVHFKAGPPDAGALGLHIADGLDVIDQQALGVYHELTAQPIALR